MALSLDAIQKLNIMSGTARSLEQRNISPDDEKNWDRDFGLLIDDLKKLVDPELGMDLEGEKDFYTAALQVAKGYFNDKPFGGLKSSTGQFGFRLLGPQDFKTTATSVTPAFYSWAQTVTTTSAKTYVTGALGYASSYMFSNDTASNKEIIAFHRLISYKPEPKLMLVEHYVNDYPYAPYSVEPFSKIQKPNKLYKLIPMPARILLHPGGKWYCTLYFDLATGSSVPSGSVNIDIEIGPFGLVFGEYDLLKASTLV